MGVICGRVSSSKLAAGQTRRRLVNATATRVIVMVHGNMSRPGLGPRLLTDEPDLSPPCYPQWPQCLAAARLTTSAAELTLAAEISVTEGGCRVTLPRADHRANCRYITNGSPT